MNSLAYNNGRATLGELKRGASAVVDAFNDIVGQTPDGLLSKDAADPAKFMIDRFAALSKIVDTDPVSIDLATEEAQRVALAGKNIANSLRKDNRVNVEAQDYLNSVSEELSKYTSGHAMRVTVPSRGEPLKSYGQARSNSIQLEMESAAAQELSERRLAAIEARISSLNETAATLGARIEELVGGISETVRATIDSKKTEADERIGGVVSEAAAQLAQLHKIHDNAKAVSSDVAISALARGYSGGASDEAAAANLFRNITLGLMTVVVIILSATMLQLTFDSIKWQESVLRLLISLALTVPAGYTAREAGKHRAQAVELRKTALDFAALAPYLETIPEPDRSKLKTEIAQRVFFADAKSDSSSSYGLDPQQLILRAMDMANDAIKKR